MIIKSRVKATGRPEVMFSIIDQNNEEHVVLKEALISSLYFKDLLTSGYTLTSLDGDYEKDGQPIDSLPIVECTLSEADMEAIYNRVGVRMFVQELMKHVKRTDKNSIKFDPTQYRITTREAFLKYLETFQAIRDSSDVKPINSFVAPSALFSIDEYLDPANLKYIQIMENRRCLRFTQLQYVEGSNVTEVIRNYMKYGLDGLYCDIVKHDDGFQQLASLYCTSTGTLAKSNNFLEELAMGNRYMLDTTSAQGIEAGFSSADKALLWEDTERGLVWKYGSDLDRGHVEPVHLRADIPFTVYTITCPDFEIQYDASTIVLRRDGRVTLYKGLQLINDYTGETESIVRYYTDPKGWTNRQLCLALAVKTLDRMKTKSNASSFHVLCQLGLKPQDALHYMSTVLQFTEEFDHTAREGETVPVITMDDCVAYAIGAMDSDDPNYEVLDDMAKGVLNIDEIAEAYKKMAAYTCTGLADFFEGAITCMKAISYKDLVQLVDNTKIGSTLVLKDINGNTAEYTLKELNMLEYARIEDLNSYRTRQAQDAYNYVRIKRIAREVGDNSATRHVAIEFDYIKKESSVETLLNLLEAEFKEFIDTNVPDALTRNRCHAQARIWSAHQLFNIAYNNPIGFKLGQYSFSRDPRVNERNIVLSYFDSGFDSILRFADTAYSPSGEAPVDVTVEPRMDRQPARKILTGYRFNTYFVNATVAIDKVIPVKSANIPEISFMCMWNSEIFSDAVKEQLYQLGVIKPDDRFYRYFYRDVQYQVDPLVGEELVSAPESMMAYGVLVDKELTEATSRPNEHIRAVRYPAAGIWSDFIQDYEITPTEGSSGIDVHVGFKRDLDYQTAYSESFCYDAPSETKHIKKFDGLVPEVYLLGLNPIDIIPEADSSNPKQLIVSERTQTLITVDTKREYSIQNVQQLADEGYLVKHMYDNKWIVCDLSNYYTVEV